MSLYPYEMKTNAKMEAALRSSLVKVFYNELPEEADPLQLHSVLPGQSLSVQLAVKNLEVGSATYTVHSVIEAKQALPFETVKINTNIRKVEHVPVHMPVYGNDGFLIREEAGLYPDLLKPLKNNQAKFTSKQWETLWIELEAAADIRPGTYTVNVWLQEQGAAVDANGFPSESASCRVSFDIDVPNVQVGKPDLIHTEWFHTDCLADYYRVDVFSEEHWAIVRRFVAAGVKRGNNMLLTPIFTPPLDTVIGGERTTVQLVGVERSSSETGEYTYAFDFTLLDRWIDMALEEGVEYIEMAHLFTQWGAKAAPKIMADCEDGYQRIFGWDTPASGTAYGSFLGQFLPKLVSYLDDKGLQGRVVFHVSDEPVKDNLADYVHAKSLVEPYVGDYKIMDALSSFEFYQTGAVQNPVVANNHLTPFTEAKVPGLWAYYCVSQWDRVPNRFMTMASARNRINAWLLYQDKIEGFLHWGFNFYNSQYSLEKINPFQETTAGRAFSAGDAFVVYPGDDGEPWESLRLVVLGDSMSDLAALQALDRLNGEGSGDAFLAKHLEQTMTWTDYPRDSHTLLALRQALNEELGRSSSK